jgi:hypothetical protein
MPKLHVQVESNVVSDYHENVQWGDWHTVNQYAGCRVMAVAEGKIGYYTKTVEVDFEPQIGQVVFPILVGYGTGDTFGRSEGLVQVVAVVNDPEKAVRIQQAITDDAEKYCANKVDVEGLEIYTYNWKGYFESFEWCRVETELVRA